VPAKSADGLPIGALPVDAIFTPTRKVNFTVEPIHIGQETTRERLSLEVWTDGTISPVDAVSHSGEMLMQLFTPFVNFARAAQTETEKKAVSTAIAVSLILLQLVCRQSRYHLE
jgi:DNA-directed RNA polymerase subunit alpha